MKSVILLALLAVLSYGAITGCAAESNGVCTKCDAGFLPNGAKITECFPMAKLPANCKYAKGDNDRSCTECMSGFLPDQERIKYCVPSKNLAANCRYADNKHMRCKECREGFLGDHEEITRCTSRTGFPEHCRFIGVKGAATISTNTHLTSSNAAPPAQGNPSTTKPPAGTPPTSTSPANTSSLVCLLCEDKFLPNNLPVTQCISSKGLPKKCIRAAMKNGEAVCEQCKEKFRYDATEKKCVKA